MSDEELARIEQLAKELNATDPYYVDAVDERLLWDAVDNVLRLLQEVRGYRAMCGAYRETLKRHGIVVLPHYTPKQDEPVHFHVPEPLGPDDQV